ncbi:MAG: hypothetical protein LH606_03920 [Cytophagaceae bacterium]|nr:hypothetical protein [Cytophagaceae bacterium]
MRKPLMISLIVLLATMTTFAQNGRNATPEQRADRQTQQLSKTLALSKEQTEQVYTLNLDRAKQATEFRTRTERPDVQKMRASQTAYEAKLKPILSAEQWTSYEKFREDRKDKVKTHRKSRLNDAR